MREIAAQGSPGLNGGLVIGNSTMASAGEKQISALA
jgi:hypothetical protein